MFVKSFVWFVLGLAGGFVVAHFVNKDPRGHEMLAQVDARIGEFTDRIGDAYREQETHLATLVAETKDAAAEALDTAKRAASEVVDQAKSAAADLTD